MKIRLGYVAIAKKLGKKITSSSTVTFTNYNKISTSEKKLEKLKAVSASNLKNLGKILNYNIENNIHFYRITSALIPLVTHPEVGYWGHREFLKKDVENTKINLLRQAQWFEDFKYDLGKMVIHIGGATYGKESGIERFITNFKTFPEEVTSKIIIENDDKTYTAKETLFLCNELKRPMVLDIHHHNCNNANTNIYDLIPYIFATWKNEKLPPKLHFSSPRDSENDRKHSDFINAQDFVNFLENIKHFNTDIDIMLECKEKDLALFKLADDIKELKPEYTWIDQSTFIV